IEDQRSLTPSSILHLRSSTHNTLNSMSRRHLCWNRKQSVRCHWNLESRRSDPYLVARRRSSRESSCAASRSLDRRLLNAPWCDPQLRPDFLEPHGLAPGWEDSTSRLGLARKPPVGSF